METHVNTPPQHRKALVMFCDSTSLWWLRFLKPGYRHCFVAISMDAHWVVYEPLLNRTEITLIPSMSANEVRSGFQAMGCTVQDACVLKVSSISRKTILRPYSCVEAVQRILGMSARAVYTPYQLYKYLHQKGF